MITSESLLETLKQQLILFDKQFSHLKSERILNAAEKIEYELGVKLTTADDQARAIMNAQTKATTIVLQNIIKAVNELLEINMPKEDFINFLLHNTPPIFTYLQQLNSTINNTSPELQDLINDTYTTLSTIKKHLAAEALNDLDERFLSIFLHLNCNKKTNISSLSSIESALNNTLEQAQQITHPLQMDLAKRPAHIQATAALITEIKKSGVKLAILQTLITNSHRIPPFDLTADIDYAILRAIQHRLMNIVSKQLKADDIDYKKYINHQHIKLITKEIIIYSQEQYDALIEETNLCSLTELHVLLTNSYQQALSEDAPQAAQTLLHAILDVTTHLQWLKPDNKELIEPFKKQFSLVEQKFLSLPIECIRAAEEHIEEELYNQFTTTNLQIVTLISAQERAATLILRQINCTVEQLISLHPAKKELVDFLTRNTLSVCNYLMQINVDINKISPQLQCLIEDTYSSLNQIKNLLSTEELNDLDQKLFTLELNEQKITPSYLLTANQRLFKMHNIQEEIDENNLSHTVS